MAGDWIKMRSNLWDDPRVARICDLTGSGEAMVVGALYWLWTMADQHTSDGCLPGLSMNQIDRKTGLKGFAAALVDIDWLRDDAQGVVVQHFEEHNGESAKKRCQTAKRVAKHRGGNGDVTQPALQNEHTTVTPALAREEKRREEKEEDRNTEKARKRAAPPDMPPDVSEQVWTDWLALRKSKKAPVTPTVLKGAREEAAKAQMSLERFLVVWCRRGSQGLEAAWLKQHERQAPESFRERELSAAAERVRQASGGLLNRPTELETLECHSPQPGLIPFSRGSH